MLTEDYIMRLINQALAVVLTALGLKKKKKYAEALQSLDQAKEILLGLDPQMVDQLDDGAVIDLLISREMLDVERAHLLADIYFEQAEISKIIGQSNESEFAYQRSLRLYLEAALSTENEMNLETIQKIEAVRQNLNPVNLNAETCLAMLDYLERLLGYNDELLVSAELSRRNLQADLALLNSNCG